MGRHSLASKKVRHNFKMVKIINVVGLAIVGAAVAEQQPLSRKQVKPVFKGMDTNGDKFLDAAELSKAKEEFGISDEMINDADKNNDGRLNFNEFFQALDADENRWSCGSWCRWAKDKWNTFWNDW